MERVGFSAGPISPVHHWTVLQTWRRQVQEHQRFKALLPPQRGETGQGLDFLFKGRELDFRFFSGLIAFIVVLSVPGSRTDGHMRRL